MKRSDKTHHETECTEQALQRLCYHEIFKLEHKICGGIIMQTHSTCVVNIVSFNPFANTHGCELYRGHPDHTEWTEVITELSNACVV